MGQLKVVTAGAAEALPAISSRPITSGATLFRALADLLLVAVAAGCQGNSKVTNRRIIQHQALIDFSGLAPREELGAVKVSCSVPRQWEALSLKKTPLYAHQQWKSPSGHTGVGVVHVRLPFPLNEQMLLWFAKREYTKSSNDGRLIGQWKDEIGRAWFEAENNKYHVRGYAIVRGFNAWMVYFGTKSGYPPDMAELSLAARCVETFVPDPKKPIRHPEIRPDAQTASSD